MKMLCLGILYFFAVGYLSGDELFQQDMPLSLPGYYHNVGTLKFDAAKPDGLLWVKTIAKGEGKLGCKLQIIPKDKGAAKNITVFWNRQLGGTAKEIIGQSVESISFADASNINILFYDISKSGKVMINSVTVTDVDPFALEKTSLAKPTDKKAVESIKTSPDTEHLYVSWKFDNPPQTSYYHGIINIPLDKILRTAFLRVVMHAQGRDRVGLKLRGIPKDGSAAKIFSVFWNKSLTDNEQEFSGITDAPVNPDLFKSLTVMCYAIGDEHTRSLKVNAIQIYQTEGSAPVQPLPAAKTWTHLEFKPDFFMLGVYLYGNQARHEAIAKHNKLSIDEYWNKIFSDIAKRGCNTVYLSNLVNTPDFFRNACRIAEQYKLKIIAQGTVDSYLRPAKGQEFYEKTSIPSLNSTFPQYNDISNLYSCPVLEEVAPKPEYINMLQDARKRMKILMPEKKLLTLHNNINSMRMDTQSLPEWFGFDRYRFRIVEGGGKDMVISTPSDMAILISREIGEFYQFSAQRGRPLIFVAQGYKQLKEARDDRYKEAAGYREVSDGVWEGYFRYMPKNGMYLQFYLAMQQGCRGYMVYHYLPWGDDKFDEQTLLNLEMQPQWFWDEATECIVESKSLFPLFSTWFKEAEKHVECTDTEIFVTTFIRPDIKGKFIFPVNSRIALFDGNNPRRTTAKTQLKSNAENLQGFSPVGDKKFVLTSKLAGTWYEVLSGEKVDPAHLVLKPGRGKVYFCGDSAELNQIRKELNLR